MFKEAPGVSRKIDAHLLFVTTASEHKDAAFQVIKLLLSDENELIKSKAGKLPAIVDQKIRKQFGVDVPSLKGKNLNVVYNYKPAPQYLPSFYEDIVKSIVNDAYYNDVYTGKVDINTALRKAEELANKQIATEKGE
jgi:multiple sugar transport system substrate-binding protein